MHFGATYSVPQGTFSCLHQTVIRVPDPQQVVFGIAYNILNGHPNLYDVLIFREHQSLMGP